MNWELTMKETIFVFLFLMSTAIFAKPVLVESDFSFFKVKSEADFSRLVIKAKEENLRKCRKIISTKGEYFNFDNVKQLCGKANNFNYTCSLACGEEEDSSFLHTPLNSYCSFSCEDGQCSEESIEKMKKMQLMKNDITCNTAGSGTFGLSSGDKANYKGADKCVVYTNNNDTTVTCHSLCKRPLK